MSLNGSAYVKHSEAMSDEIITAMSTACGASIFVFKLFKKKTYKAFVVLVTKLARAPGKRMMRAMHEYRAK